ncbi:hypothetical protein H0A36_00160 [Endozoicomonas sp. SM1973]|uniref:PEP-CTERM protein-sorting domain-containing protein n=1 Tax=Spartinivicinus marinus TaxID=2994442 RepID=A0A853I0X3_9GAMM|nr:hypothetical protein [Spartinivicinus marinus]MCX4026561.1 hypothetical protein [Spartinivicinus marinus]NYZ64398.1 hypothetical protein [Spartinivicinus marinus]
MKKALVTLALGSVLATTAQATVYTYEQNKHNRPNNKDSIEKATFTYDNQLQQFTFKASLTRDTDGLWAVVNRGSSPSNKNAGFMHIDLKNNVITVNQGYRINGANYLNPVVQRFDNVINYHQNTKTLDFSINVAQINEKLRNQTGDLLGGIEFNNTIGGWVHADYTPNAQYNGNTITHWKYSGINGIDFHNRNTTIVPPKPPVPVPTPAPLALIALGLLGLYRRAKA